MRPTWKRLSSILASVLWLIASSMPVAAEQPDDSEIAYFETHIRPILFHNCYSCHSDAQAKSEGHLVLDSRAGWLRGGDQGAAVVPKDLEASLLVRAVRYNDSSLQMPPVAPLSAEQIAKLEHWIMLGAPAPEQVRAAEMITPSDPVAGKQHWAFQPLRTGRDANPNSEPHWTNPIDHWLQVKLDREQLQAVSPAQPNALIRRLLFVLHGLPPTPTEVEEFESEESVDGYEQTVDRLLASPRFGERWGRHWLDLARYADSNGSDENFLFREAWRYRNWVFDAFNQDMPFDQFTTLQLAGDQLPFENSLQRDEQRIATGFLLLGPKVLLGNNPDNQKMEIADEQIDTIGRVYFAQTLGCARCHDHKFDPVPTKDYYALAGIFTSTQVMEQRYMLGEQRVMEQLIGLGDNGAELDAAYEQYWRDRPQLGENKGKATEALEALKKPDEAAFQSVATNHAKAVASEAAETSRTIEERIAAQQKLVDEFNKAWKEPPPIPLRAMISSDRESPKDEQIRIAGQFNKPGEAVPRGFLTVLSGGGPLSLPEKSSGRLELARWITDRNQASGQLAARVLANRIWYHLMGRGIVRTVDNFGRTGETPAHPELLDYLAQELIDHNWSIKHLIRQIVLSDAFRRGSEFHAENYTRDPENISFWRYNRRRLDPEAFRDSTLAVAGMLDTNTYPSTVNYLGDQATAVGANKVRRRTDFPCRSVYLPVIRNDLPELFEILDFTDPQVATGMRRQTMVPTQGLFMLNDEQVMDAAVKVAELASANSSQDPQLRIAWLYRQIIGQPVAQRDLAVLISSYNNLLQSPNIVEQLSSIVPSLPETAADPQLSALSVIAHALFASSRFQFIE
jgi:Protein of unknown function (DUF1549)/Protein of unknown function (DUF1553)/Planctomycete cytochrome C